MPVNTEQTFRSICLGGYIQVASTYRTELDRYFGSVDFTCLLHWSVS